MKKIKQSVINTFERVGIDYKNLDNTTRDAIAINMVTGEKVKTTELIAKCIEWVFKTYLDMSLGRSKVTIQDFDRVRYFVAEQDINAYMRCVD